MKTSNDITFICLPPAQKHVPSPAFSYLKSYCSKEGLKADVIYANILFKRCFDLFLMDELEADDFAEILPFISLINHRYNLNRDEYIGIKYQSLHPNLFLYDKALFHEMLSDIETEYDNLITNIANQIIESGVSIVGFTSKFYQWIPSIAIATKIKDLNPTLKIISGGWSNSQSAADFLTLHQNIIDYTLWGEGEVPLTMLINYIKGYTETSLDEIPRLVYKEKGDVRMTKNGKIESYYDYYSKEYIPNFSDYIRIAGKPDNENQLYPIERGRGCNWNRCNFCYLAQGYRFRIKPNQFLIKEIRFLISEYGITSFFFTDNDVIGSDLSNFEELLDSLIALRQEYPAFQIKMAEIISKDLNAQIINKMHLAGFMSLQLGIEAISEELLSKINKKQTVLDNFYVIKTALKYGINILGANLIYGTPSETSEMVLKTINNLHHFRFILSNNQFSFNLIPLGVANYSKYLFQIKKDKEEKEWNRFDYENLVDSRYLNSIDPYSLFDFVSSNKANELWSEFERLHRFYKQCNYSYEVKNLNTDKLLYTEYVNGKEIKGIEIEDKIVILLLKILSQKKYSYHELFEEMNKLCAVDERHIQDTLNVLSLEGLIWIDEQNGDIVSIIDVEG